MIAIIQGDVLEKELDSLVVNVGGIGFRVHVPAQVADQARVGEVTLLYTHFVVREDNLSLYGFGTREERDFYQLLLGVDGIGPRTGLAVLSTLTLEAIRQAVASSQVEVFCRVPGIGRKTAQKMLLHLEDKVGSVGTFDQLASMNTLDGEILSALTSLGYSVVESQAALQAVPKDTPAELEARLKAALAYFSR